MNKNRSSALLDQERAEPGSKNNNQQFSVLPGKMELPQLNLPHGGGAIKGIEEKFQVNAVTGTSSFSLPIPVSPSRQGFSPALGVDYDSGRGNGPFGLGWQLSNPSIRRKTDKQLPRYRDEDDADVFVLSGAEDLVPVLEKQNNKWQSIPKPATENGINFTVKQYRPRIEGLFARIEKWKNNLTGEVHWRSSTKTNIWSVYGLTAESRIADPAAPERVFEWLLCKSYDDKGNLTVYQYKQEDFKNIPQNIFEKNRINKCTQTYLKTVLYGVKKPWHPGDAIPAETEFMFRVIFDYGEHADAPIPKDIHLEKNNWPCRKDPFSTYRPGFELRTYRRCSRALVFHCFDELPHSPYLVKSINFYYDDEATLAGINKKEPGFSFLVAARQNGHIWDAALNAYRTKSFPDITLFYQQHEWNTKVQTVDAANIANAPVGIDSKRYLWIDLFSEGISGILTEQAGGWFYKSNLGKGNFSPAQLVSTRPSFSNLSNNTTQIQELEGDGVKYLVHLQDEPKGFFKLSEDDEWNGFNSFHSFPNLDPLDPNLRLIDLTGDGRSDMLYSEETLFRWHGSLGEKGFQVSESISKEIDEEKGPAIVFADKEQSIFLADLTGDGLTAIIRIRNGEVCYWPNLGYGRFGAKVSMANSPVFDSPELFNPAFLRLADIDGSGTTDIIYLGKQDCRVWMNYNGNEWSAEPVVINAFAGMSKVTDVAVLDFLGSGTACIVYSSPLQNEPVQYIDLMNSRKPHLLTGYKNNCGKQVTIEYKTSTQFYLEDLLNGRKWITKLPFAVHCISTTRTEDSISQTVFVNSYKYSHGYFDHYEKEFRGFGRVEQFDTQDYSLFSLNNAKNVVKQELHQPPVRTVSWFHTGAYTRKEKISEAYKKEYFQNALFNEHEIPAPEINASLPDNSTHELSATELRQAYRACKGMVLRTEVYADDDSAEANLPYVTTESTFTVKLVQPSAENAPASFLVIPSQSVSYDYERAPADPRISHSIMIDCDELGNVLKSASIVYPRVKRPMGADSIPDKVWDEQNKMHIVYSEADFTKDKISASVYRLRAGYESRSYEINGIAQPAGFYFNKKDLATDIAACQQIMFEEEFDGSKQKRLSGQSRIYYSKDDLSGPLQLGVLPELGMINRTYELAFTKNSIVSYYNTKVNSAMLSAAGYVHLENDEHWWVPSGTAIYPANAAAAFYMPIGAKDVFNNERRVQFDKYNMLVESSADSLQNTHTASNDYRTLSPVMLTDPNLNRSVVETDELGIVVKTAVMGKQGSTDGDTLADPTGFIEYDVFNWQNNGKPNFIRSRRREQHGAANTRWQESYSYADGGGTVIMMKMQAEPGKAKRWNPGSKLVEEIDANPRWIGNGRTIYNNKGNPIKSFEQYFSTTHEYESEDALVETGASVLAFYDPTDRNIRTEYSNGTFTKTVFNSWKYSAYDPNDTVKDSKWYIEKGSPDPALIPEPADPGQRAAWLAAKHYDTPATAHSDTLGRVVYTVSYIDKNKTVNQYSQSGLLGRSSIIFDQLGRKVSEGKTNLLGVTVYGKTAEKGERWTFTDVMGRVVKIWDNDVLEFRTTYDALFRPVANFVKQNNTETLFSYTVYGEMVPNAAQQNLRNKCYQLYDQSGVTTTKKVDFKGNILEVERRLTAEYKQAVNWQVLEGLTNINDIANAAAPLLENEVFSSAVVMDALGRPLLTTLPDKTIIESTYNISNFLDSLRAKIRGQGDFITFLENQDYDAKGQRQFVELGNGLFTRYYYDPQTFRLTNLVINQDGQNAAQARQDIHYEYDATGNVVYVRDDAQQTHFFSNAVVKPEQKFEYDAAYQLIKATGREHAGLGANDQRNNNDLPYNAQLPHANDLNAVRIYTEQYQYDDCGNLLSLSHAAPNANWNSLYHYEYQDDPNNTTNRLKSTNQPGDPAAGPFTGLYAYDIHGNMTSMPHLAAPDSLAWNFMNQLKSVNLGGGGNVYYVYGLSGSRTRKIIERQGKRIERIYLGPVELYREYKANKTFERSTVHISDSAGIIAQVDTKVLDTDNTDAANELNANLIRYQHGNLLGAACMETDETGTIISYEEYHPFGTSAYRSSKSNADLSLKRFRFSGKEKDEETGFYYFGARYYAGWLGRWISTDPGGFVDGYNLFRYCRNNPINYRDPNGMKGSTILVGGPDSLKNESKYKEAKAVMEQGFTQKMGKGEKKVVIDKMHFDKKINLWIVDKWHFEKGSSAPPPQNGGGADLKGGDANSGGGKKDGTGSNSGGSQGKPGGTPGGSPTGSAQGKPGGSPNGTPGGGGGQPSQQGSPGGSKDGVKGGGGSGKKPETWYEKTFAVVGGVFMGAIDIIGGLLNAAIHPIDTVINMGKAIKKGWDEDGLLGAVNAVNPLYHALVAGYESYQAVERGDYFGAGRQGFHSAFNVVATVGVAVGGAGLAARGLGLTAEAGAAESSLLAGSRNSIGEVLEGAGVKTTPYTPSGTVFGQSTSYTCVAGSCRMLASDVGVALTEEQLAAALETAPETLSGGGGAALSDAPAAMQSVGVPGGTYLGPIGRVGNAATIGDLQAALATGRSVAVSVRIPGRGLHAAVVDSIADGTVFIRDPLPVGTGSAIGIPLSEFTSMFQGKIFSLP